MNRYILPLAILILPLLGRCQDNPNLGIGAYMRLGASFTDYTGLNGQLNRAGYTSLKAAAPEFGLGITHRFRKLGVGLDIAVDGEYQTSFYTNGFNFMLFFYTDIIQTRGAIFSPQIGIGDRLVYLTLTQNSSAPDFNAALTTHPNRVQLDHDVALLDMGLTVKLRNATRHHTDFPIFRIGYRYGLGNTPWKVNGGGELPGAPHDRTSSFYLDIMAGSSR